MNYKAQIKVLVCFALAVLGCAPTVTGNCKHLAVAAADTWQDVTGDPVRLTYGWGKGRLAWERHIEAQRYNPQTEQWEWIYAGDFPKLKAFNYPTLSLSFWEPSGYYYDTNYFRGIWFKTGNTKEIK